LLKDPELREKPMGLLPAPPIDEGDETGDYTYESTSSIDLNDLPDDSEEDEYIDGLMHLD
jgi:hypothetical protein